MRKWTYYMLSSALCLIIGQCVHAQDAETKPAETDKVAEKIVPITFEKDLKKGFTKADKNNQPVVLYFGAKWCGWCRKMKTGVFTDDKIEAYSQKYVWLNIDIDDQPAVAQRYQIFSVPQTMIANRKGDILVTLAGYRDAKGLEPILKKYVNGANQLPPGEQAKRDLAQLAKLLKDGKTKQDDIDKALIPVFEMMVQMDKTYRNAGRDLVLQYPERCGDFVMKMMGDKRLGYRACAGELMKSMTRAELPFDAFAKKEAREKQVNAYLEWLKQNPYVKPKPSQEEAVPEEQKKSGDQQAV